MRLWLISILFLAACTDKGASKSTTGKVQRKDLVQRVTLSGNIEPARKTTIQISYDGFVRKLFVKVGEKVQKNDPLVSVSQSLQSSEPLFPIRAPYEGVVVQVLKKEGESVTGAAGTTGSNRILRLDDLSKLYVDVLVAEIDVEKIKIGMDATIRAASVLGRTYKGKIRNISLASVEQERWNRGQVQFSCEVEILDPDSNLKSGMSVSLDLIAGKKEKVLVLGHEFIQKDGDQFFVTLADGERREIKIGMQNEEVFEILEGLKEGDEVRQIDFVELMKKGV